MSYGCPVMGGLPLWRHRGEAEVMPIIARKFLFRPPLSGRLSAGGGGGAIHRADGNSSEARTRQALGFIFYSVDAKDDVAAREAYKEQLAEQQKGKI